jgi:hypothetical protein
MNPLVLEGEEQGPERIGLRDGRVPRFEAGVGFYRYFTIK